MNFSPLQKRVAVFLIIASIWLIVTAFEIVEPVILPSPTSVLFSIYDLIFHSTLGIDLIVTARRVFTSIILATVIGVPIGLFFGYRPKIYLLVEHPLNALRSIPATCLFPLILIVVGVGESAIVSLATYPCILIMMVNSATGGSLAERSRIRQAKALGANLYQIVKDVLFFDALPYITASIRTCVSYALVLIVAVEMFIGVGKYGLGRKIFDLQSNFQIPETYAAIIITGLLGITLNSGVNLLERRLLHWMPTSEKKIDEKRK